MSEKPDGVFDPHLMAHALSISKKAEAVQYTSGRLAFTYSVLDALDYLDGKIDTSKSGEGE